MPFNWLRRPRAAQTTPRVETKAATGFVAFEVGRDARWTSRDYAGLSREGFMRNPVAHRCVRMISEAAAAVPWLLYEGPVEHEMHPLLDLVTAPNPAEAGGPFFEALYGYLLLAGNAYVERIDGPGGTRELHLLRPDRVTVEADGAGWPVALTYRAGGARRLIPLEGAGGPQALHLKFFHPLDDHYGFPPLEAASMALDIHNSTGRWNKALLDNSARPSGALVYAPKDGGNLTEEQFDRLKAELEDGYTGAVRAGRPLLLEGGLDWKAMGLSPRDMDFIEAKNAASRDIALALGVPPMLLGIPGDNTYSNYAEANRGFYRLTVLPLMDRIARSFSAWLGADHGPELRLTHDLDRIDGLSVERDALWQRVSGAAFLTDDEKREAVGYAPRAGGAAGNANSTGAIAMTLEPRRTARRGLETKYAGLALETVELDGSFAGYASLFGVPDLGHDVVERGAFARSLARRGLSGIRMLYQHDPAEPIGVWTTLKEDTRGLYVEGRLAKGVKRAREVLDLMRETALDGLSIGFRTIKAQNEAKSGLRLILEADLWEISVVTFPMLPGARIASVKAAPRKGLPTVREFERWLTRDAGLTRSEAKAVIAHGFAQLAGRRDAGSLDADDGLAGRIRAAAGLLR